MTIAVIGPFAATGAAFAEEGLESAAHGGCGHGAAVETVTRSPVITPVPTKIASQTTTTTKSGGLPPFEPGPPLRAGCGQARQVAPARAATYLEN